MSCVYRYIRRALSRYARMALERNTYNLLLKKIKEKTSIIALTFDVEAKAPTINKLISAMMGDDGLLTIISLRCFAKIVIIMYSMRLKV